MERGDRVIFKVKRGNGEWSAELKGFVDSKHPHAPLRLFTGRRWYTIMAINLFCSDNTYLRSGLYNLESPLDKMHFTFDEEKRFDKQVSTGMEHGWKMRFAREATSAALTFLMCCRFGNVPLHKDIVQCIARMIYRSEWDQNWKRVRWGDE